MGIRLRISVTGGGKRVTVFEGDSDLIHLHSIVRTGDLGGFAPVLQTVDGILIEAAAVRLPDGDLGSDVLDASDRDGNGEQG